MKQHLMQEDLILMIGGALIKHTFLSLEERLHKKVGIHKKMWRCSASKLYSDVIKLLICCMWTESG